MARCLLFTIRFALVCSMVVFALPWNTVQAKEPMTQQQALRTLNHSNPQRRFEAMNRLALIGTADAAEAV